MATTIVAKRTTTGGGGALALANLSAPGGQIPANPATVELTLWNTPTQIQNDSQLLGYIQAGQVVLVVNGEELDATASENVLGKSSLSQIPRIFTVSATGDVDYNSIKAAVDAAVAAGASNTNPYQIVVYPGVYVEAPTTVPSGVSITGANGDAGKAIVVPSNPATSLYTLTGGHLHGISLSGITDAASACAKITASGSVVSFCSFTNTTIGALATGAGVIATLEHCTFVVSAVASGITTGVQIEAGANILLTGCTWFAPAALLPAYAPGNPIGTGIKVTGVGTQAAISDCDGRVASNGGSVSILADDGAEVAMDGCAWADNDVCVKIGSVGSATQVNILASSFVGHTTTFDVTSSTGVMSVDVVTDTLSHGLVAGAEFAGTVFEKDNKRTLIIGDTRYEFFPSQRTIDVETLFHAVSSSGVLTGGGVTNGVGLNADVAAGTGIVVRDATDNDAVSVSWGASSVALTASSTNYIAVNPTTLAVEVTTTPPSANGITLREIRTSGTGIRFSHDTRVDLRHIRQIASAYLLAAQKFRLKSGVATSQGSTATKITVGSGIYFRGDHEISVAGAVDATFSYFYGAGAANEVASQTSLDTTQYDNAGVLTAMTAGYFRSDTVIVTSDNRISVIYGTAEFSTQAAAEDASTATIPSFMDETGIASARVVVQQGVGIAIIKDVRPIGTSTGGGGSGVTDHSLLSNLSADDHTQYLLASGARAMSGSLDMGANNVTNVGTVDGVDVSAHAARHNPGGVDALALAAPVTIGSANSEGSAASYSRSDHVHAHGNLAGGSTHALAVAGGAAGFMSGADKTKLDGVADSAAALTSSAPADVTKAVAVVGVASTAARADHKHDIATAAPGATSAGTVPAEGSSTSLARADHVHQSNTAPVNVTKAAAAIGTSGEPARADHKHDVDTAAASGLGATTANAEGSATSLARADHTHAVSSAAPGATSVGTASAVGSSASFARADHVHQSNTAPTTTTKAAAVIGTSGEPARADHKHDVSTAAPTTGIGGGNSEGSSTSLARADHNHALRTTTGPTDLTIGAIADGQVLQRSGTTIIGAAASVFGQNYAFFSAAAEFSTTATTFQQATRFTTASLPAGTYAYEWSVRLKTSSSSKATQMQVDLDDSAVLETVNELSTDYGAQSMIGERTFGSPGTHTFDFDLRSTAGAQTAFVDQIRLRIWRVS